MKSIPCTHFKCMKGVICGFSCIGKDMAEHGQHTMMICDMIKGNESLVENFDFNFLTPHSHDFKMLHFDANPLQLDIWLQSYEGFDKAKNNMKQMNLNTVLANISKQHPRHPTHSS